MCDPPVVVDVVDSDRERWFVGTILAKDFSMRTIFLVFLGEILTLTCSSEEKRNPQVLLLVVVPEYAYWKLR